MGSSVHLGNSGRMSNGVYAGDSVNAGANARTGSSVCLGNRVRMGSADEGEPLSGALSPSSSRLVAPGPTDGGTTAEGVMAPRYLAG
jgi:hypothetical protein